MARWPADINLLAAQGDAAPKSKAWPIALGAAALAVALALAVAVPVEMERGKASELESLEAERARYSSRELGDLLRRRELLLGHEEAFAELSGLPALALLSAARTALPDGGSVLAFRLARSGELTLSVRLQKPDDAAVCAALLRDCGLFISTEIDSVSSSPDGCELVLTLIPVLSGGEGGE